MIIFRNNIPKSYQPYSSHLHPYQSVDYEQPKVFLWHSSPTISRSDDHVDKKPKNNNELNTKQTQPTSATKTFDGTANALFRGRNAQVFDSDTALTMSVDLPGVNIKNVSIEVDQGVLSIAAERQSSLGNITKMPQQFFINDMKVDLENLEANLTDGVLTITLPKKAESKPIAISITNQSPPETKGGDGEMQFSYDLPGVKANDIQLEFHDRAVTLHATRHQGGNTANIDKQFLINPSKIDTASMKAYLADGVLTIVGIQKEIPKKTVSVSSGAASTVPGEKSNDTNEDDMVVVETVNDDDNE